MPSKQKSNPGGQIDLRNVVGRDHLIATIWEALDQQSVIMTAERRIGKTTIIRKMCAEPPGEWVPVLQDLEKYHSADEFAFGVYQAIEERMQLWNKTMDRAKELLKSLGGIEVGGLLKLPEGKQEHWKTLLVRSIDDLVQHQVPKRLIFLWDEMPYMLDSIRKREGEQTAIEILDILRSLRQKHEKGFRMVLTGSIGLHHVLTQLRETDYRNEPVNDMYPLEVTPLEPADAEELAKQLIAGEQIESDSVEDSARAIADQADCFAFYIHHIVRKLKMTRRRASPETVQTVVQEQLINANDPWELGHYRDRIPSYYPNDAALVETVLDCLAAQDQTCTVNTLLSDIKNQMPFDDRGRLLRVLRLMERDHYLKREPDGSYGFRFPLIRRWWRLDRGL